MPLSCHGWTSFMWHLQNLVCGACSSFYDLFTKAGLLPLRLRMWYLHPPNFASRHAFSGNKLWLLFSWGEFDSSQKEECMEVVTEVHNSMDKGYFNRSSLFVNKQLLLPFVIMMCSFEIVLAVSWFWVPLWTCMWDGTSDTRDEREMKSGREVFPSNRKCESKQKNQLWFEEKKKKKAHWIIISLSLYRVEKEKVTIIAAALCSILRLKCMGN